MARLLACWELGLGLGHLATLVPVAAALNVIGHESWLAARDVTLPLPANPFVQVLPAPIWRRSRLIRPARTYGEILVDGGFGDDAGLIGLVAAWLAMFGLLQPAGVYGDHAPASLLAAHVAGLPAARLGSPFTCLAAVRPMPGLLPGLTLAERADSDAIADRVVRGVCRHFGAPMLDGLAQLLASAPPFLTSFAELEALEGRSDSAFHGPLTGLSAIGAADWPDAEGPRIFVYLPFDRAMAAPLAAALATRGWPVIWVCDTPPQFALPANIRHEIEPIAIGPALQQAALLVGRGGHGISLDALMAGCPQMLMPDTQEAQYNAESLAAHGVARIVPVWDATMMGACLDEMTGPGAIPRGAVRDYDGLAAAAALAKDLAAALQV